MRDRTTGDFDPRNDMQPHLPRLLHREVFFAGQTVIAQGSAGCRAYYIEKGRVEIIVREGPHTVKVCELGAGEIFGEMALIGHTERSATVRAADDTTVTVIAAHEFERKIGDAGSEAACALIRLLMDRLRGANHGQVDRYREFAAFQDRVAGLLDKAENGIEESRRARFRAEVTPLLEQIDRLLDGYR